MQEISNGDCFHAAKETVGDLKSGEGWLWRQTPHQSHQPVGKTLDGNCFMLHQGPINAHGRGHSPKWEENKGIDVREEEGEEGKDEGEGSRGTRRSKRKKGGKFRKWGRRSRWLKGPDRPRSSIFWILGFWESTSHLQPTSPRAAVLQLQTLPRVLLTPPIPITATDS